MPEKILEIIKSEMEKQRFSVYQLADMSCVPDTTIYSCLKRGTVGTVMVAERLLKALGYELKIERRTNE